MVAFWFNKMGAVLAEGHFNCTPFWLLSASGWVFVPCCRSCSVEWLASVILVCTWNWVPTASPHFFQSRICRIIAACVTHWLWCTRLMMSLTESCISANQAASYPCAVALLLKNLCVCSRLHTPVTVNQVTRQYRLVMVKGWWCSVAGKCP